MSDLRVGDRVRSIYSNPETAAVYRITGIAANGAIYAVEEQYIGSRPEVFRWPVDEQDTLTRVVPKTISPPVD